MPLVSSRGGAYSRLHRNQSRLAADVYGILYFNHGATSTLYRSNTREKFVLATSVVTASTNLINTCTNQAAVGNSKVGIIATGFNGNNTPAKEKFTYTTETSSNTTSSTAYNTYGCGAGNKDMAVFHLGWGTTYTKIRNTHMYATDAVAATTSASTASYAGSATGTADYAVFSLGGTSAGASTLTEKFVYATKLVSTWTTLPYATSGGCAAGMSTDAFGGIGNSRNTYRITYATSTVALAPLLPVKTIYGSAASDSNRCVINLGGTDTSNVVNKKYLYTFSTKTLVATTSGTQASWGGSALSTAIVGVNV